MIVGHGDGGIVSWWRFILLGWVALVYAAFGIEVLFDRVTAEAEGFECLEEILGCADLGEVKGGYGDFFYFHYRISPFARPTSGHQLLLDN